MKTQDAFWVNWSHTAFFCINYDKFSLKIRRELHGLRLFDCLSDHDLENIFEVQDLHSTQLIKKVIDYYLQIRFFRYGQHYTSVMIKKCKHGMRQQANKMLIFKGLWDYEKQMEHSDNDLHNRFEFCHFCFTFLFCLL